VMHCPEALAMAESVELKNEMKAFNSERLVDYRRQMALKRIVLEKLANSLTPNSGERYEAFRDFVREHEGLMDYARFRAACESRGGSWQVWPRAERQGVLSEGDFSKRAQHYHAYVQWVADEQLRSLQTRAAEKRMKLYLDLPLGVHRYGYDTWHETGLFVRGVSAGAPPDTLFHKGQDWGFPPLHPDKIREQGHRYPIAYLRHHMQYSDILRVDHVMGMHHLFWVPEGMEATEGVYVRYPADETYAIMSLESHRYQCMVVGENLGTVPPYVNDAMVRHNIHGLYVTQYEVPESSRGELREVPSASVASLNTHDMPPFSAFWQGLDIERWAAMGLVTEAEARVRTGARHAAKRNLARFLERHGYLKGYAGDIDRILEASLSFLAESPAELLLVNLEDLWLETEQQNIPGVVDRHPNWQRKARFDFETFSRMPEVLELVRRVRRVQGPGMGEQATASM
jgi:4-alpha-glucanotransferase